MLAIQARTFSNYYYMSSNNTNHPARFVGNAVAGILFENKVDYTSTSRIPYFTYTLLLGTSSNSSFSDENSILRLLTPTNPRHTYATHISRHSLPTSPVLRQRGVGKLLRQRTRGRRGRGVARHSAREPRTY
jgi:hypothetical protein